MIRPAGLTDLLILIILCCSCTTDRSTEHRFALRTEDGISTAITTGGPKYNEPLFTYEEVLILQQSEEREESLLYEPAVFLRDEDGYFYIQDTGNYRIAVFSPGGEFSHSIGREGEGPGEFRSLRLISVENSNVTVHDNWLQRTLIFSPDGLFLRAVSRQTTAGGRYNMLYPGLEESRILLSTVWEGGANEYRREGIRITIENAAGDTLATIESPLVPIGYLFRDQNIRSSAPIHFGARARTAIRPEKGILVTTGSEPVLSWYDFSGNLQRNIRIELEPEAVSPEERSAIINEIEKQFNEAPSDIHRTLARLQRDYLQIPDRKAFWSNLLVDEAGFIWLQKPQDALGLQAEGGVPYRLISPDGEYLGDTAYPLAEGRVSRGHFLGYRENPESGAVEAVVFRLIPAVRSLRYP